MAKLRPVSNLRARRFIDEPNKKKGVILYYKSQTGLSRVLKNGKLIADNVSGDKFTDELPIDADASVKREYTVYSLVSKGEGKDEGSTIIASPPK